MMNIRTIIIGLIIGLLAGTSLGYGSTSSQISGLQNQVNTLQTQVSSVQSEANKVPDLQQQLTILTNDKSTLQTQLSSLQPEANKVPDLQQQLTILTNDKSTLQSQVTTLQTLASTLQTQIDTLTRANAKPYIVGVKLFDPQNNTLNLVGFNIRDSFTENDFIWLKDHGYNAIRLNLYWGTMEPVKGAVNWTNLDNTLNLCQKYHIWAWVDMHQWEYSSYFKFDMNGDGKIDQGNGFPSWLVSGGGYTNDEAGKKLFSDDFLLKRGYGVTSWNTFEDFWASLVTHCKAQPYFRSIVCWEMLNEPTHGAVHDDGVKVACNVRYTEWIRMVRAIDPSTIICLSQVNDGFNQRQNFSNIMWSKSAYPEFGVGWSQGSINAYLADRRTDFNVGMGVPYVISETGISPSVTLGEATDFFSRLFGAQRAILGDGQCSWFIWRYDVADSSGGYLPPRLVDGSDSMLQSVLARLMGPQ